MYEGLGYSDLINVTTQVVNFFGSSGSDSKAINIYIDLESC